MRGYKYSLMRREDGEVSQIDGTHISETGQTIEDVAVSILERHGFTREAITHQIPQRFGGIFNRCETFLNDGHGGWAYLYVSDFVGNVWQPSLT